MADSVLTSRESRNAPLAAVGAKAATLARLAAEGIDVPEFFVVPAPILAGQEEDPSWAGNLLAAYDRLCAATGRDLVAVRSSGAEEDAAGASFAGQFASVLGVRGHEALLAAVDECRASARSPRADAYRAGVGIAVGTQQLAVIVQVQVVAEKAGVLFTRHPLAPEGGFACIEAAFGSTDAVTSGRGRPDTLTIDRATGVIDGDPRPRPVLTDYEARHVLETGLPIERLLGGPQDIEWGYESGRLWVLQARPITAMSPDEP